MDVDDKQRGMEAGFERDTCAFGLTAAAGGGQANAVLLTKESNHFSTVGTAADSAKLPPAKLGVRIKVHNAAAANAMNVFPASGEFINALAVDTAISVAANKVIEFHCTTPGRWGSVLSA